MGIVGDFMKIKYLGHSAFEIETRGKGGGTKILIDPFLVCVPSYKPDNISDIFVTHAHGDHLGSAIEISKSTGASITAVFELANYCSKFGAKTIDLGLGSWTEYDWGRAVLVPAFHSSSTPDGIYGGCPCGVILEIENKILYHAGDTCLNTEMKMIGEVYEPDIAMLPIGGKYTMDIEHALIAAEWLGASEIIPMHYNTFDAIKVDISEFERQIRELGKIPMVMRVGESYL